mmetsp:Transcript_18423/g.55277  ORF Transcript_18423/g.55277 Transcript_18423/m.55277 type:complete len:310 (+) Transcript_18423:866-1795(+)
MTTRRPQSVRNSRGAPFSLRTWPRTNSVVRSATRNVSGSHGIQTTPFSAHTLSATPTSVSSRSESIAFGRSRSRRIAPSSTLALLRSSAAFRASPLLCLLESLCDNAEEEEEEEERRKSRAKKDAFEAAVVVLFSVLCFSCSAWRARSAETRRRCNRSDGRDEVESELPARSEAGRTRGLTPLSEFVLALPPTVALPVAPRGCAGTQIAEAEEADWEEEDDVPSDAGEPLAVTSVAEKERESLANSVLRMESLRTTRRGWLLPAGTSWLAPVATRLSLSSPGEASLPAAALLCSPLTLCSALPLVLSCA